MWFLPPPPVSFSQDVAPVLALHCNGCHGDGGGLSTRSYAALMAGGNLGRVVIAGNADGSLLIHFLDGRRGEAHRMPLGGQPFSAARIEMFRRWIDEGAKDDAAPPAGQTLRLPKVPMPRGKALRVSYRVSAACYLTLTVREGRRVLFEDVASVKSPAERVDAGEPGQQLFWDVRAAPDWPKAVTIELRIQYAAAPLDDTEFHAQPVD